MNYYDLAVWLAPEIAMTLAALAALGVDLSVMRRRAEEARMRCGAVWVTLGCGAAAVALAAGSDAGRYLDGMIVIDEASRLTKMALLAMTAITAWLSVGGGLTRHAGEYHALLSMATVGMMMLVGTTHALMIFVALELLSLSLYILVAINKRSRAGTEAALKYFLFGGMSAAFLLFGLSLAYGLTGQLSLEGMAAALKGRAADPLLVASMVMVVAGFGFKVAAAPLHWWAPDVYQGAPWPCAALIASGSKVASFYVMAKVMLVGFGELSGSAAGGQWVAGWVSIVAVVAALSLVVGNLAALAQTSVRRLLAYSAIAQAGYILVGMLGGGAEGMASVLFYAITYAATTLGAFAVVGWVEMATGRDDFEAFAGLSRRAPLMSFCLLIFLLSLAGIPPLVGFFGKFYLFTSALRGGAPDLGLLWLVCLAVGMNAVSLYYYLGVLKQVYAASPSEGAPPLARSPAIYAAVLLLAATTLLLGCAPQWLLEPLAAATAALGQ